MTTLFLMEYLTLALFGVVAYLAGSLTVITAVYALRRTQIMEEIIGNIINDAASDETTQKSIYQIGALLGQGAKQGFGVQLPSGNRGGKFRLQDFALEMAAQFFAKGITQPAAQVTQQVVKDKFFNT